MTTTPGQGTTTPHGDPLQVTTTPPAGGNAGESSTGAPVKEQAKHAAETTASEAKNVAGTAASEAKDVAGEAKEQARDLLGEARTQVTEQTRTQRDRLTQVLDQAADELRSMASSGGGDGVATEVVRQIATRAQDLSSFLGRHEPGELITEVRRFARRRPGMFLLGAVAAGMLAGRTAKGASSAGQQADATMAGRTYGAPMPSTQAPAQPVYTTTTPAPATPTPVRLDEYETSTSSTSGGYGQTSTTGGRP